MQNTEKPTSLAKRFTAWWEQQKSERPLLAFVLIPIVLIMGIVAYAKYFLTKGNNNDYIRTN
jgi:hypothetical protein